MSELLESIDGSVLTLSINRPHAHNTLCQSLSDGMVDALNRSLNNPDIRCIVLTGVGNIFCAGGDIGDQASGAIFGDHEDPKVAQAALVKKLQNGSTLFKMLHTMPKPTLAVIPGAAAGAGLALALACDLRFCLDTAKLTTAFAKVGVSTDCGLSYFLPRLVGSAKARELCFTSDVLSGQEALKIGLVNKVAGRETFENEARAYAKHLASLATVAVGYMKENLNAAEHLSLQEICDLEAENLLRTMATSDHKKAAAAFIKKETITFEGR